MLLKSSYLIKRALKTGECKSITGILEFVNDFEQQGYKTLQIGRSH